jgi:HPt (histidine-containing phosphotransfer) domain-containing protein
MANRKIPARIDLALLDPDGAFPARLEADRAALVDWLRNMQTGDPESGEKPLKQIATLSHRLAGAAGTFGYAEISDAALALEELILDRPADRHAAVWFDSVRQAADRLVQSLTEA